jgi:hypothetical protein
MVLKILKAVARPFLFVWDRIHNGQADMEAVYPESFHPTGEEAVRQGSVISGFIAGADN